jgi:GntR family transcriptional regulator
MALRCYILFMTETNVPYSRDSTSLVLATAVAARIMAGEFVGRMPPERDIAKQYGVAYQTVRRALEVLRQRGLIIVRHGRGTFAVRQFGAVPQFGTPMWPAPPNSAGRSPGYWN